MPGCRCDRFDQSVGIVVKARVGDLDCVASHERREILGQIRRGGHRCVSDQCRDHADATPQCSGNLSSNEIVRIIQSAPAARVRATEPGLADDGDKGIARADGGVDTFDKILPGLDRVDVDEHVLGAETLSQAIRQSTRIGGAVLTPVTDQDLAHPQFSSVMMHEFSVDGKSP
jgi:hypothetical protein